MKVTITSESLTIDNESIADYDSIVEFIPHIATFEEALKLGDIPSYKWRIIIAVLRSLKELNEDTIITVEFD